MILVLEEKLESVLENINIEYGFVDKYNVIHKHIKKNYYLENYNLQSVKDTIKYNVGTCWEYVELVRYYLNEKGIVT